MTPEVRCPFCGETRMIEPVGNVYLCWVCSKTFEREDSVTKRSAKLATEHPEVVYLLCFASGCGAVATHGKYCEAHQERPADEPAWVKFVEADLVVTVSKD